VLWRKQQLDEDVQMNIMGNVNEPFSATNRFEVAFTSLAPRYKFELSVLGTSQQNGQNVKLAVLDYRAQGSGELIPVLGSQPAGDVSHKPGARLPLLSARPAVTPATLKRAATNFAAW